MTPLNILELNLERGWRGGERQTLWSMAHFRECGARVALLARPGEALARAASDEGFDVIPGSPGMSAWVALVRHARRFDIVHAQTAGALTWAVLTAPWHRRPVVATRRVAFDITRSSTIAKYRKADRVVAISEAAAAPLRAHGIADVAVIPSAVRPPPAAPERVADFIARHQLAGKRVVATVAALTIEKDPAMLVRAVAQLNTPDVVMVHFGQGTMADSIRSQIAELGLSDRYLLPGFTPNVEQLYPLMEVFVLSSRMEGLGSSALDAFLANVPVAATAAGGLAEVLADGRGLLSPVGDAASLAVNIDCLLSRAPANQAARRQQVADAYDWVVRRCGVAAMGDAYLDLFAGLTRRSSR